MRGGTDRRSGTGDDVAARIVGARDEAEPFGVCGKGRRRLRGVTPMIISTRPGAARTPLAPALLAASINRLSEVASA